MMGITHELYMGYGHGNISCILQAMHVSEFSFASFSILLGSKHLEGKVWPKKTYKGKI
jgi:hypothetical protein